MFLNNLLPLKVYITRFIPQESVLILIILSIVAFILFMYIVYLFFKTRYERENQVVDINSIEEYKIDYVRQKSVVEHIQNQPEENEELIAVVEEAVDKLEYIDDKYVLYRKSFKARLIQAPTESQERYSELKNMLFSYEGVYSRINWHYDSFILGKNLVAKIAISEKIINIYLDVKPEDAETLNLKFMRVDHIKKHLTSPIRIRIRGPRGVVHAKKFIEYMMLQKNIQQHEIPHIDYKEKYQSNKELVEQKLIKVINSNKNLESIIETV